MKSIEDKEILDKIKLEIDLRIIPCNLRVLLQDTDAVIFGGAVRNSISGDLINDIDVICYQHAFDVIDKRLLELKFVKNDISADPAYVGMHGNIKIKNVYDYHNKGVRFQLILLKYPISVDLVTNIEQFVDQVDFRACAMLYAPLHNILFECIDGAFEDCRRKRVFINRGALMHNTKKCAIRVNRLTRVGWKIVN